MIILWKLFMLAFLIGLIFFVVWALRALDKKQLKKWAVWLLVIGLVGTLLFSFVGKKKFFSHFDKGIVCDEGDEDCSKWAKKFKRFADDEDTEEVSE